MLGKIIVRDDIVYLQDDPVIEPASIDRNVEVLGETLRKTGLRRLLVHGASQTDGIDDGAIVWLTNRLVQNIPDNTRIAFAHAGARSVANMADRVCHLLEDAGFEAIAVNNTGQAEVWLRQDASHAS